MGACKAGTKTCAPDGSGYGACEGEVVPLEEVNCDGSADIDCDGALPKCTGALAWAKVLGDAGIDEGYAAAIDFEGNVILTGGFQGTISYAQLASGLQAGFAVTNSDLGTGVSGCSPLFCGSAGNQGNPLMPGGRGPGGGGFGGGGGRGR